MSPDTPAEFSRSSPQYAHAIAACSLAFRSACCFSLRFAASYPSEIADRHDLASCPRRCTSHSVAPSYLGHTLGTISVKRNVLRRGSPPPLRWVPPTDLLPCRRPPVCFPQRTPCERSILRKRTCDGLALAPHRPRTAFPFVVAGGPCHVNLPTCPPLSLLYSATNLSFRLGWWPFY